VDLASYLIIPHSNGKDTKQTMEFLLFFFFSFFGNGGTILIGVAIRAHLSGSCRVGLWVYDYMGVSTLTQPTCLLNGSRFINSSMTHLLNGLIMLICLSDFIKMEKKKNRINQIELW